MLKLLSHWSDGDIIVSDANENSFEGQDPVEYITKGFKEGRGSDPRHPGVRIVSWELYHEE